MSNEIKISTDDLNNSRTILKSDRGELDKILNDVSVVESNLNDDILSRHNISENLSILRTKIIEAQKKLDGIDSGLSKTIESFFDTDRYLANLMRGVNYVSNYLIATNPTLSLAALTIAGGCALKDFLYVNDILGFRTDSRWFYTKIEDPEISMGISREIYSKSHDYMDFDDESKMPGKTLYHYDKNAGDNQGKGKDDSKVGVSATLFQAEKGVSGSLFHLYGEEGKFDFLGLEHSVNVDIGKAGAKVGASVVAGKDGFNAEFEAGASFSAFETEAGLKLPDNDIGTAYVGADVKLLSAEAGAKAQFGIGPNGVNANVKAEVGATLFSAEVKGGGEICGLKAEASAGVKVGIGASAEFGIKDGKVVCELGAALGIGFDIKIEVGLNPFDTIKSFGSIADTVGSKLFPGLIPML